MTAFFLCFLTAFPGAGPAKFCWRCPAGYAFSDNRRGMIRRRRNEAAPFLRRMPESRIPGRILPDDPAALCTPHRKYPQPKGAAQRWYNAGRAPLSQPRPHGCLPDRLGSRHINIRSTQGFPFRHLFPGKILPRYHSTF